MSDATKAVFLSYASPAVAKPMARHAGRFAKVKVRHE